MYESIIIFRVSKLLDKNEFEKGIRKSAHALNVQVITITLKMAKQSFKANRFD